MEETAVLREESRVPSGVGSKGGRQKDYLRKDACVSRPERVWRMLACLFMLLTAAVTIAFAVHTSIITSGAASALWTSKYTTPASPPPPCGGALSSLAPAEVQVTRTKSSDVFRGLSASDYAAILDFLLNRTELNLTPSHRATLKSNYVFMIEDDLPPKDVVLAYLDGGADAKSRRDPPQRRARVVIFNGAVRPRSVREYIVSPVPNVTTIVEAEVDVDDEAPPRQRRQIRWSVRPIDDLVEKPAIASFLKKVLQPTESLFKHSYGGQWLGDGCKSACLFYEAFPRADPRSDDRLVYLNFFMNPASIEGYYLYPVPLQAVLREPSNASAADDFRLDYIYYGHRRFDSVASLLAAVASGAAERLQPFDVERLRGARYASPRKRGGDVDVVRPLPPPLQIMPQGPRFSVGGGGGSGERHVEYLDWSFDLHFRTSSGLALHNVEHRGQRIAYEIGMQDVVVFYGGVEPFNLFQSFFDNGFSLGIRNLPLLRGTDCPSHAAYLDNHVLTQALGSARRLKNAACVFEQRNSVPLRRHYSESTNDDGGDDGGGYNFAFSMPDNVLVVRQILTIWNYDYIFDYEFHQNGVIETKVSSSGYVIVTNAPDRRYGYPIDGVARTLANVHSHLFNFRYDLDVGGRRNRLTMMKFELENTTNPVIPNTFEQLIVVETTAQTERQALVRYDFSKPGYYTIQSEEQRSANGQPKGYRIQSSHFAHVLQPDTNPQMKGASWAKTQLAVTKYKDSERGTASIYTQGDPSDPVINFENFYTDDEPIVGEDLVAWATVGMHHIPSLEDVPVTTTPGRQLSVALVPLNYFDEDPSMSSSDAIVVFPGVDGTANVITYGSATQPCVVQHGDTAPLQ